MNIVEFLNARLDQDEQAARAAIGGPWEVANNGEVVAAGFDREIRLQRVGRTYTTVDRTYVTCDREGLSASVEPENAAHIARHDPARVLRDVAAKRRILARHPHRRFVSLPSHWPDWCKEDVPVVFPGTDQPYVGCETCDYSPDMETEYPGDWCDYVKDLAAAYSDHPDYRQEWAFDA